MTPKQYNRMCRRHPELKLECDKFNFLNIDARAYIRSRTPAQIFVEVFTARLRGEEIWWDDVDVPF